MTKYVPCLQEKKEKFIFKNNVLNIKIYTTKASSEIIFLFFLGNIPSHDIIHVRPFLYIEERKKKQMEKHSSRNRGATKINIFCPNRYDFGCVLMVMPLTVSIWESIPSK